MKIYKTCSMRFRSSKTDDVEETCAVSFSGYIAATIVDIFAPWRIENARLVDVLLRNDGWILRDQGCKLFAS